MKFLLNPDGKTIHAENPLGECNIPAARAEGNGTELVNFRAAALTCWELSWRVCEHCIGNDPTPIPKGESETAIPG